MPIWNPANGTPSGMSPSDLAALLVAATGRLDAAVTGRVRAIGLRQTVRHAPLHDQYQTEIAGHKRFAGGLSTARDKVTGEIIQAVEVIAFAAK